MPKLTKTVELAGPCQFCGHTWEPRTAEPKQCPSCHRYNWKASTAPTKMLRNIKEAHKSEINRMHGDGLSAQSIGLALGYDPVFVASYLTMPKLERLTPAERLRRKNQAFIDTHKGSDNSQFVKSPEDLTRRFVRGASTVSKGAKK